MIMGVPNFPPRLDTDLCKPFYEGLAAGELRITACPECGAFYWYPPEVLPCHPESHAVWKPLSGEGTIYSFTTVERSLLPGADPASVPHTILLVEPAEAPQTRIISLLVGDAEPACGMRVKLSPIAAGEHVLPGFVPA